MRGAGYADVERGERGNSEEHLTVTQFKMEREAGASGGACKQKNRRFRRRSASFATDKAEAEKAAKEAQTELRLLAPKLKHMEKLAAEYSSDPEDLLPLPDRMESAKSYRGEKVKTAAGEDRQGGALPFTGLTWMFVRNSSCCSANMIRRFRI